MLSRIQMGWGALRAHPKLAEWLPVGGVLALFLIITLGLLPHGVFGSGDSPRYIDGGQELAAGQPVTVDKAISYAGYIGLMAASISAGFSMYGVVIAQLAAALLAILAAYDLGRAAGGRWAGLGAAALMAADSWLSVQNFVIMTDALYTSLVVISVWAIYQASERGGWRYLAALASLAAAASVRPNGYLLIPIALIFIIWRKINNRRLRWLASAGVIAGIIVLAVLSSSLHGEDNNTVIALRQGLTMWVFPAKPYWAVPMPADAALRTGGLGDALRYGLTYPLQSTWLMLVRAAVHFSNIRPDVSPLTNLSGSVWLLWVYPLAAIGLYQNRKHPLAALCLAVIAAHTAIVVLTWADRRGRFLFYILPLLYVWAAAAVTRPGLPARGLWWRVAQIAGVVVAVVRIVSGADPGVYHNWLPGDSYLSFGGPAPFTETQRRIDYGGELDLLGFKPIPATVRAGTSERMALYWQGLGPMPGNYQASVWLADEAGKRIGGEDSRLGVNFFFPGSPYGTSRWAPGDRMADQPLIDIPVDAPAKVRVYLSVYGVGKLLLVATSDNGQPVQEGQMLLQTIVVAR